MSLKIPNLLSSLHLTQLYSYEVQRLARGMSTFYNSNEIYELSCKLKCYLWDNFGLTEVCGTRFDEM